MPNSYFKFKQFTINQDKCAMKVCTDACLFGALVAGCSTCLHLGTSAVVNGEEQMTNCLDIGAGTGLLSLMFAQKNDAVKIDAVEIDKGTGDQLKENVEASPWTDRIEVYNENILSFSPNKKYNYIFTNPPFFEKDLQSPNDEKNNAKHDTSLSLLQLLQVVNKLLTTDGFLAVLLPYHRVEYFIEEANKYDLHLSKKILLKQTMKHKFFRGILFFNRKETETHFTEIIIRDAENKYTPQFAEALKDYYLCL